MLFRSVVSGDGQINRWIGEFIDGKWNYKKFAAEKEAKSFTSPGTLPSCIAQSDKGIFVGTKNDGLLLYNPETELAKKVDGYNEKEFGKEINDLLFDKEGNLWIGAKDGLIKYDGQSFTLFNKKNSGYTAKTVNVLYYANDMLWVGSKDGIFSFDGTNWNAYTKKEGVKQENIVSLTGYGNKVFAAGSGFLGSTKTLVMIENGQVTSEEAPKNFRDLVIDSDNCLWLGSDLMYKKENETIQVYSEEVPFSLKPIIRMVYYCNNEFLFHITRNPSINVKSKSTSNSPQADFVKEYANRINTFDKDIIYIMKTK